MPRFKIKHELRMTKTFHFIGPLLIHRRKSHICREREREADFQILAYYLQEDTALTLFRSKRYEAESAADRAGAAAGLNQVETEAHASVFAAEYHADMANIRFQHQSE